MTKSGSRLARAQGREIVGCVQGATREIVDTAEVEACMVADERGKIEAIEVKLVSIDQRKCSANPPPFGYGGSLATIVFSEREPLRLARSVYGSPVGTAIVPRSTATDIADCQARIAKDSEKYTDARLKAFKGCVQAGLRDGAILNEGSLALCLAEDSKGKVATSRERLAQTVQSECAAIDLAVTFPGDCAANSGGPEEFAACLASVGECHACVMISSMTDLQVDCDLVDDSLANGSCRICGDGNVEIGEECDDAGESATCDVDCTLAVCGDGTANETSGEACDDGNSNVRDDCVAGASCSAGDPLCCKVAVCGDGFVHDQGAGVEACDLGRANCALVPAAANPGASCTRDTDCPGTCSAGPNFGRACRPQTEFIDCVGSLCDMSAVRCTGGNIDFGIEAADACRSDCSAAGCGDGVVDSLEECDAGGVETGECNGLGAIASEGFDRQCLLSFCGDGYVNVVAGEVCDDGNDAADDACPSGPSAARTCVPASCGDAHVCTAADCTSGPGGGSEECDVALVGGSLPRRGCDADCSISSCGDGQVNPFDGELCDDGTTVDSAQCDMDPAAGEQRCTFAECGDGWAGADEVCDDGAFNGSGDGLCLVDCSERQVCGDGVINGTEGCEEGGETASCDGDCTLAACGDGTPNQTAGEVCDDGNDVDGDGCDAGCILTACGNGVLSAAEECDDGNTLQGDGCTSECVCEPGARVLGCQDPQCPDAAEFTVLAGTGPFCASNADCGAGSCDLGLGRCVSATEDDIGFSGVVHDTDFDDGVVTSLRLSCAGPGPACGECFVRGLDPTASNCRCANDNRKVCDQPMKSDLDDCSGDECVCYEGPPSPNSTGNTPACNIWRYSSDVTGTLNVDTGAGEIRKDLAVVVHLGDLLTEPCPYCIDDVVAADGVRDGTCVHGINDGMSCDAQATHLSWPEPGGGDYSLDCFPDPSRNISGPGVVTRMDLTTGDVSLTAGVECGLSFLPQLCPCGVCSADSSVACSANGDCAGLGVCGRLIEGVPFPNSCADGVCLADGPTDGKCVNGPHSTFCDGILRANGTPYLQCQTDEDCASSDCGAVSCGQCTLSDDAECFVDPIVASGVADPVAPLKVAAYCIPSSTPTVNFVVGSPGPGRSWRQELASYFCASDPAVAYEPGVGGCP